MINVTHVTSLMSRYTRKSAGAPPGNGQSDFFLDTGKGSS